MKPTARTAPPEPPAPPESSRAAGPSSRAAGSPELSPPSAPSAPSARVIGASPAFGLGLALTSVLGWFAAFQLTLDHLKVLKDPAYIPACDISAVISCGDVMRTWQAELFGFPNMLLGLAGFAAVAALGVALAAGAGFRPWLWRALWGSALLGVVFSHWLIYQSLYVIGELCPYCVLVWGVTIALLWSVTVHGLRHGTLPVPARARRAADAALEVRWTLLLGWIGLIAVLVFIRFLDYWASLI